MAKRTISIQNPCKHSVKQGQLVIDGDRTAHIPLSEIWVVVLESHLVTITVAALSALTEAGIGVLICDKSHMPNSLTLPIGAHSRHAAIVENQLLMPKPLKNQLWQSIIKQKIENQAAAAALLGHDSSKLLLYSRSVKSADNTGREAVAAAEYFKLILPSGSRRDGPYAPALDYGYSILRAGIARALVTGGWLVSRGIHHSNDLNAFNLADDMIEPFRPFVDIIVIKNDIKEPLGAQDKQALTQIFERKVLFEGCEEIVQTAIIGMINSFKRCVIGDDVSLLKLPIVPIA